MKLNEQEKEIMEQAGELLMDYCDSYDTCSNCPLTTICNECSGANMREFFNDTVSIMVERKISDIK